VTEPVPHAFFCHSHCRFLPVVWASTGNSPSIPSAINRSCQRQIASFPLVGLALDRHRATRSALSSTIRVLQTGFCGLFPQSDHALQAFSLGRIKLDLTAFRRLHRSLGLSLT
jgi:hypothetical protein